MNASPDLTAAAIKMAISLVVVLAMVWGLYRLARKAIPATQGTGGGKLIRVVENQYLGIKKNILMVQVPGALLVLGVTADKIELLTRLDDPKIIERIDVETGNRGVGLTFKSQLQRFIGPKNNASQLAQNESIAE